MIYADANVLIRLIEGDATTRAPIEARLQPFRGIAGSLVTSRLSRLECRIQPIRVGDAVRLAKFDRFFNTLEVRLLDVSPAVVEKATDLRARLNVKTPDAIHLASAILARAAAFLTGDLGLTRTRCTEIPIEVL
ncbi:MAG TPA: PIN domain-containing protein [Urbifossiella sp.]|nr:PIN domain-containing protein [Urbifossiella sp.]